MCPLFTCFYTNSCWYVNSVFQNIQDRLLHSCCPAEVSIDQVIMLYVTLTLFRHSPRLCVNFLPFCFSQKSQSSTLEYWVYLDNQHNMADCPVTRFIAPPATSVTQRPCLFTPVPGTVTALKMSSVGNSAVSSPMKDTCSPANSMCSPPGSVWDTLRSTSRSPSCSDQCPVSAAAHLHLLGESLFLIGHHLQETNVSRFNVESEEFSFWSIMILVLNVFIDIVSILQGELMGCAFIIVCLYF